MSGTTVDVIDSETGEVLNAAPVLDSVAVVPAERAGIAITSVADCDTMAVRLAKSELVPVAFRNKPANVFLALNMGMELGLSAASSLRAIHVVDGRPSLSADAMIAVIRASNSCRFFGCIESTDKVATYETHRHGDPSPRRESFSIEDAKDAGLLGKDNWEKYPRAMLKARAKAALARDVYPDVLHGIYTPDELDGLGELDNTTAASTSRNSKPTPAPNERTEAAGPLEREIASGLVDKMLATKSEAQLATLIPQLKALTAPDSVALCRKVYGDHLENLRKQ